MVMYGGNTGTGNSAVPDTYLWTGTDWSLQSPNPNPGARFGHRMKYDDATQSIVMFGGQAGNMFLNDTWFWNGAWTQCGNLNGCNRLAPTARFSLGMAYDRLNQREVVYAGGTSSGSPNAYPDTWLWDATNSWRCVHNCSL
jgi:Galactose oxidase, central domain